MLALLDDKSIFCGDPPSPEPYHRIATGDSDSKQLLEELSKKAASNVTVSDGDVQQLLRRVFRSEATRSCKTSAAPTPYVHTRQSLQIMYRIACCTMNQLGSEHNMHTAHPCSPVLLSGDTGTGKTFLLFKYLVSSDTPTTVRMSISLCSSCSSVLSDLAAREAGAFARFRHLCKLFFRHRCCVDAVGQVC
jgi:hypothetical protein